MPKISGNLLGLEINGNFIDCETSCEFTFEVEMRGASAVTSGRWREVIPGIRSWSVSVNAMLVLSSVGNNVDVVYNAFISGEMLGVKFRARPTSDEEFTISGNAFVTSGAISGPINALANFNTTLTGSGPFTSGNAGFYILQYGYRSADPFGDEENLIPQFSTEFEDGAAELPLNFTKQSYAQYLFVIVPADQPIFTKWENSQFNFGDIPDQLWRESYIIGNSRYYVTRTIQYITSEIPNITLLFKNVIPDQFYFTDVVDAVTSSEYVSNPIEVEGITEPILMSISGSPTGYFKINNGAWMQTPAYVSNGDIVTVKLTTGATFDETTSVLVDIGGVTDSFDVKTQEDTTLYYAYRSDDFTRNNCPIDTNPATVTFNKTYTATGSQAAADALAVADPNFDTEGQAYANSNGECKMPTYYIWGKVVVENEQVINSYQVYADIWVKTYRGNSASFPPAAIPSNLVSSNIFNIGMWRSKYNSNDHELDFSISTSGTTTRVSPVVGDLYPKQLIRINGSFVMPQRVWFYAFQGKLNGEMQLLQTITP